MLFDPENAMTHTGRIHNFGAVERVGLPPEPYKQFRSDNLSGKD